MLTGLASVIYPSNDLEADKAFWCAALGVAPYFDQPFYVGFTVDGRELGLDPNAAEEGLTYPVAHWAAEDLSGARDALQASGATLNGDIRDIGQGVLMATMRDRAGNIFGLIQRPTG